MHVCVNRAVQDSARTTDVVNYDDSGQLADEAKLLAEAGLEVGFVVKKKADAQERYFVIQAIGNRRIKVKAYQGSATEEIPYTKFRDHWSMVMDVAELKDRGVV